MNISRLQYDSLVEPITPPGQEAEIINMDKWFMPLSEPIKYKDVIRQQYAYPTHFAPDFYIGEQESVKKEKKWGAYYPDKVWDVKRQQWMYPTFFIDPRLLTTPETINMDKWFVQHFRQAVRYFAKPHLYPFFSMHTIPFENAVSLPSKRNSTDFTQQTKNTTDFSPVTKNTTDFTPVTKNPTDWIDP